jgi:hypothetical protein
VQECVYLSIITSSSHCLVCDGQLLLLQAGDVLREAAARGHALAAAATAAAKQGTADTAAPPPAAGQDPNEQQQLLLTPAGRRAAFEAAAMMLVEAAAAGQLRAEAAAAGRGSGAVLQKSTGELVAAAAPLVAAREWKEWLRCAADIFQGALDRTAEALALYCMVRMYRHNACDRRSVHSAVCCWYAVADCSTCTAHTVTLACVYKSELQAEG